MDVQRLLFRALTYALFIVIRPPACSDVAEWAWWRGGRRESWKYYTSGVENRYLSNCPRTIVRYPRLQASGLLRGVVGDWPPDCLQWRGLFFTKMSMYSLLSVSLKCTFLLCGGDSYRYFRRFWPGDSARMGSGGLVGGESTVCSS